MSPDPDASPYPAPSLPVTVAVANDYEVIVKGVACMINGDQRIDVVDLVVDDEVDRKVDVVLFDAFGHGLDQVTDVLRNPIASRVAVYTWTFDDVAIDRALDEGVNGYLSKALTGGQLADAVVRIASGEVVVSDAPSARSRPRFSPWPGKDAGLSEREAQVLALITQGLSNQEIADTLFLSINSIKTHIRKLYAKLGVRDRSNAILWGIDHGLRPGH